MIEVIDAAEVLRRVSPQAAVAAIRQALADVDPAGEPLRTAVAVDAGQLLLMPSSSPGGAGVKIATVAPGNAVLGLPRIHGVYVLFDPVTLAPQALLDGAALTTLRTPAVSVAAVLDALPPEPDVVVFGAGPQGQAHVATLAATVGVRSVRYVVRDPSRAAVDEPVLALGDPAVDDALRSAAVIVCASNARVPLFDADLVGDDAVVIAVGSHEPDARELPAALLGRAQVVVEDVVTALREAGDVVLAVADGALAADDLVSMRALVTGAVARYADRPLVFKSTGMAWEDLAVARAVLAASGR